jgi:hypothetical protein
MNLAERHHVQRLPDVELAALAAFAYVYCV